MALVVYWYDFVCFAIVGVAAALALYILWRRESFRACGRCNCNGGATSYESLLVAPLNGQEYNVLGELSVGIYRPRGQVTTTQLWTTCWKGLHPIWLFVFRLASFLILSGFLAWDALVYGPSIYIYYTEWTFSLVALYFAIGTIVSAYGCTVYYSNKPPTNDEERSESISTHGVSFRPNGKRNHVMVESIYDREAIVRIAGFWGYLMQIAYQTCAGAVIITDIVFWCIIVPFLQLAHFKLNILMGCMHTLNIVFLLLDTSINSLPFPWFRISYFVLWSCLYVIFQWVIHACGFPWWPYPFLELSTPWAPLWYFSLAVLHIPCYGIYSLLVRAKNSLFPRLFPHSFVTQY